MWGDLYGSLSPPIASIGLDVLILPTTNLWVTHLLVVCAPLLQGLPWGLALWVDLLSFRANDLQLFGGMPEPCRLAQWIEHQLHSNLPLELPVLSPTSSILLPLASSHLSSSEALHVWSNIYVYTSSILQLQLSSISKAIYHCPLDAYMVTRIIWKA